MYGSSRLDRWGLGPRTDSRIKLELQAVKLDVTLHTNSEPSNALDYLFSYIPLLIPFLFFFTFSALLRSAAKQNPPVWISPHSLFEHTLEHYSP
jgi:hypothetical protein